MKEDGLPFADRSGWKNALLLGNPCDRSGPRDSGHLELVPHASRQGDRNRIVRRDPWLGRYRAQEMVITARLDAWIEQHPGSLEY